ncbi:dihydroorotate dehydrogenase [Lambiella insularis]|nr:dihydroorotate dehydrogenase [Lambiella insularis]
MFSPPLLNSANVWASTEDDLEALYQSPHTGAITIRTSLLNGFRHDDSIHQYCYLDPESMVTDRPNTRSITDGSTLKVHSASSLNTLGYSPTPLREYIAMVERIEKRVCTDGIRSFKPVIFSITGNAGEIVECGRLLELQGRHCSSQFMMEINMSCPNIVNKPPPAYSKEGLLSYLHALQAAKLALPIGIKTPPYTYQSQFENLIGALLEVSSATHGCPISFITAVNTLGSCFAPRDSMNTPAVASANGSGVGGLAGAALHPLALGNVLTIKRMLNEHVALKDITIIGVGGVSDCAGFDRMMAAGASAVGVGTALGTHGVVVFETMNCELVARDCQDCSDKEM